MFLADVAVTVGALRGVLAVAAFLTALTIIALVLDRAPFPPED